MGEGCDLTTGPNDSVILQAARWLQVCVGVAAIILAFYIICRHLGKTILDSITIWFMKIVFMNCVAYSIGNGVAQSAFEIARFTAATPCVVQVPKVICLFRIIASSATPIFVLVHVSITIHHALSTLRYPSRVQKVVARLCMCVTASYVILYGFFVYRKEQFAGYTSFCSSFAPHSEAVMLANLNVMMAFTIVNFICAIAILKYNKKILSNETKSFVLSQKFQRVRNLYAMELYVTIVVIHSVTHFIHFCLFSFTFYYRPYFAQTQFTIMHAVVNIVPYYCLVGPLTFLVLIKLGRFRRQDRVKSMIATENNSNTQDVYFKGLKQAWDHHD